MKHKTLWQVFTPSWIVEEILNLVWFVSWNILDKKIIDPACWDWAFLKTIIIRIIDECLNINLGKNQILDKLENFVYGIEIDKIEYNNCISNLNQIVDEKLWITNNINWKIYNDNTLQKHKDFVNYFDFVVGNPPYIRIHNLDNETREILKKYFMFSQWNIDIYVSFFEIGFKIMKENWILGFITPNSYLHNSSYKTFRKYLKQKQAIKYLIDFKANKIFDNFSTYTAISIIKFAVNESEWFEYKELVDGNIKKINYIKYKDLEDKDWSFANIEEMNFLKSLHNSKNAKVFDFFDVQYGFATLRDNIYIWNIEQEKDNLVLFNNERIEKEILYKVVKWSTYKWNLQDHKYIIFPYKKYKNRYNVIQENELQENYPKTYNYLLKNKEELLKRDIDKWSLRYEFGRSQWVQTIHNPKIVVNPLIKDSINFYELDEKTLVYSGIFIIPKKNNSNRNIIKNILNSNDFLKYIKITWKDFSGGYKSITSSQIKNFPTNEIIQKFYK